MARPKILDEYRKDYILHIRLNSSDKKELEDISKKQIKPVSAIARNLIFGTKETE